MSLGIGVVYRHPSGESDVVFASDTRITTFGCIDGGLVPFVTNAGDEVMAPRRVVDKGKIESVRDDYPKSRRISSRAVLGYIGGNNFTWESVADDLGLRLFEDDGRDVCLVAKTLEQSIGYVMNTQRQRQYEAQGGPYPHTFFLAGASAADLKLYSYTAEAKFKPEIFTIGKAPGLTFSLNGPDEDIKTRVTALCREYFSRPRTGQEITAHLVDVFRQAATWHRQIGGKTQIRRLSRGFELEEHF
jgi:hypothetical protein